MPRSNRHSTWPSAWSSGSLGLAAAQSTSTRGTFTEGASKRIISDRRADRVLFPSRHGTSRLMRPPAGFFTTNGARSVETSNATTASSPFGTTMFVIDGSSSSKHRRTRASHSLGSLGSRPTTPRSSSRPLSHKMGAPRAALACAAIWRAALVGCGHSALSSTRASSTFAPDSTRPMISCAHASMCESRITAGRLIVGGPGVGAAIYPRTTDPIAPTRQRKEAPRSLTPPTEKGYVEERQSNRAPSEPSQPETGRGGSCRCGRCLIAIRTS